MRTAITTILLMFIAIAGQVSGQQVTGTFVLLEDSLATTAPGTPIDVYGFQITNNSGFDIFTFDTISFSGNFLQGTATTRMGTSLEVAPSINIADTFFTDDNITPSAIGTVVDDSTTLSVSSVATLGQAWVLNGATETIALFSVNDNAAVPLFDGGRAVIGSGNDSRFVTINDPTAVPEPSSMIVLGLAGCAILVRRKR